MVRHHDNRRTLTADRPGGSLLGFVCVGKLSGAWYAPYCADRLRLQKVDTSQTQASRTVAPRDRIRPPLITIIKPEAAAVSDIGLLARKWCLSMVTHTTCRSQINAIGRRSGHFASRPYRQTASK